MLGGFFVPTDGGESGIRTHDEVAPIPVFETVASIVYTVNINNINNNPLLKMLMLLMLLI